MNIIEDWRLQNQEKYLKKLELIKMCYKNRTTGSDHDHCEFCSEKFGSDNGDLKEGYTTSDNYYWICENCYKDFKDLFEWKIEKE